jgi:hypothetical protein
MKKNIAEGLPERKYAPAAPAPAGAPAGGNKPDSKNAKSPEARIRQAVYDIRYRARREEMTLQQAYADYMNHSQMNPKEKTLVRGKLFGRGGVQAEDFNIEDAATNSVANALFKVFVEGANKEPMLLTYMEKLETAEHRKYKVRVTDKNGRSYVRYATRDKISALRANPNIESVEMTGYGEPYEGEKSKGEQTAAAKAGKDYDGDGQIESGAKEHAGVVHNAIQRKRGGTPDGKDTSNVKEAFLGELTDAELNSDVGEPEIDVMRGKNKVVVNPELPGSKKTNIGPSMQFAHYAPDGVTISETEGYSKFLGIVRSLQEKAESQQQQKLFGLALSVKRGETPRSEASAEVLKIVDSMTEKQIRDYAKTKHEGLPKKVDEAKEQETPCEDDPRSRYAEMEVIKNRLRAKFGMKNPIIMASYEPDGEMVDEERGRAIGGGDDNESPENRHLGHDTRPPEVRDEEEAAAERAGIEAYFRRNPPGGRPRRRKPGR